MKSSLKIVFFWIYCLKVASYVEDFISIRVHEYNTSYISEIRGTWRTLFIKNGKVWDIVKVKVTSKGNRFGIAEIV